MTSKISLQRFALLLALALCAVHGNVVAQGDIWLTGHQVDYFQGQNGYDKVVFDYLSADHQLQGGTTADYDIALIGTLDGLAAGSSPAYWQSSLTDYPSKDFFSTADLDIGAGTSASPDWDWVIANYDCMVILSHESLGGTSMTDDGVSSLAAQGPNIQSAFYAGTLDLFVLCGFQNPNYYDFLAGTGLVPNGGSQFQSASYFESDFYITNAGCIAGIEGDAGIQACNNWQQCGVYNHVNHRTYTHFGYAGDCKSDGSFPTFSSRLIKMETFPEITGQSGCPDGDICEVVISLAAQGITNTDPCGEIVVPDIACDLQNPGQFTFNFHIGNDSGFDVVKVLIPDTYLADGTPINIEPNVIEMVIPDQTSSLPIDLTFSGGASGDSFDLQIGLMAKDENGEEFQCCALEETIELPHCCNELVSHSIDLTEDDLGNPLQILNFNVENSAQLEPDPAHHLFLVPIDPPGLVFHSDYHYLPGGVADGSQTGALSSSFVVDPIPADGLITFEVVLHNEDFSECCNEIHTLDLLTDPVPLEVNFIRGDSNGDGQFDISDAISLLGYLFDGTEPLDCAASSDANSDEVIDIGDSIFTLSALFAGGPTPAAPFPNCGHHHSQIVHCESYASCP